MKIIQKKMKEIQNARLQEKIETKDMEEKTMNIKGLVGKFLNLL